MKVTMVTNIRTDELEATIQQFKDDGEKILALSPCKIYRSKVTEYTLVVGK